MLRWVSVGISFMSSAWGAELPAVGVVGVHQPGFTVEAQDALAKQLVDGIDDHGRARGLLPAQVAGAIVGREAVIVDEGIAGLGRDRLRAATDLYNQAQPDAAVAMLEEAIAQLERAFPGRTSVEDLWEAHVLLGTARLQSAGDDGGAFATAAAWFPGRGLDAARFPPDVVEAYQARAAEVTGVEVALTVQAAEGTVVVDGVERGPAPQTIRVPPGVHHVVVVGAEGRRGYTRVEIARPADGEPAAPTAEVTVTPPWLAMAGASRVERAAQTESLYAALGARAAGIELFLLAGVDGASLHLQLYHPSTDRFSRPVEVPYADDPADELLTTLPLLLNLVDPTGAPTATAAAAVPLDVGANSELAAMLLAPRPSLPLEEPEPRRRRGWLIVAGTALGAAAIGTTVAVVAAGRPEEPVPTPDPVQRGTIVIDF